MSFTTNSARLHREKQIQNTREKENSNIQKLKNARKGKKSDFLNPSLAKTSTEIARQAKKDKKHAQEINNLKRQYGKSQKKIENLKKKFFKKLNCINNCCMILERINQSEVEKLITVNLCLTL